MEYICFVLSTLKISTIILTICFLALISTAQNTFQSNHFMSAQPLFNFAAASSYEKINFTSFFRNQWQGFEGSPRNIGLMALFPIQNNSITLGGRLMNENIGVHQQTEIKFDYAYRFQTGLNSAFSLSLSPTFNLLNSDFQSVSTITPDDPNFNINSVNTFFPNAEFGSYYFSKKYYVGLAIPNLFYNQQIGANNYSTKFEAKQLTYFIHGGYKWKLNNKNNLYTSFITKTAVGAPLLTSINIGVDGFKEKLLIGISYRTSKELVALAKVNLKKFIIGYAFQYSLNNNLGINHTSHEILLSYQLNRKNTIGLIAPRF